VLNIVLVEPEIPPNTGNVSRLCAGLDATLHLVEPLGFSISDRHLKRAGLDYWPAVRLNLHPSFQALQASQPVARWVYTSARAERLHTDWTFEPGDFLVFGKETSGLPPALLEGQEACTIRIPHWGPVRSLNLSNAVAVIAYEAMRQLQVRGLAPPPVPRLADRPSADAAPIPPL
jgi:tRNA (cytidine/uridine-2'-O-)-methyltransferase